MIDSAVAVTGGAGFIGAHLVHRLAREGAPRIVVLDDLSSGSLDRLAGTQVPIEVARLTLGKTSVAQLRPALEGVRYLFHLAAEKHNTAGDRSADMLTTNVVGTQSLIEAALAAGVERIVFASSLYAYGRYHAPPFREGDIPTPDTVYGISKLAGEQLLAAAGRRTGLSWTALRYFFVYGPSLGGPGYRSVIDGTFDRLDRGEVPVVIGDGSQVLDYVYVDDAVEATIRVARSGSPSGVLNVGSGRGVSVRSLIEAIQRAAGSALAVQSVPPDATAGTHRVADIGAIRELLGWQPETDLETGLARMLDARRGRR